MTQQHPHRVHAFNDDVVKKYYSIGEVSAMIGESTVTIRFWLREHLKLKMKRSRNYRYFEIHHIEILQDFKNLLRVDCYTIKGAIQRLGQRLNALR